MQVILNSKLLIYKKLLNTPLEKQDSFFQHDGASSHGKAIARWLSKHFGKNSVGFANLISWPPLSPNSTPLNFNFKVIRNRLGENKQLARVSIY